MKPVPWVTMISYHSTNGAGAYQPVNVPMHEPRTTMTTTHKTCIEEKNVEDYQTIQSVLTIVGTVIGFGVCILFAIDK